MTGWAGANPGHGRSFLHDYVGSGLAERLPPVSSSDLRDRVVGIRRLGLRAAPRPVPPKHIARIAHDWQDVPREDVTRPGSRALAHLGWVEARTAFLGAADDAIGAAARPLTVVASVTDEMVVEVSEPGAGSAAIGPIAATAAGAVLGGQPVRASCESIERW